MRGEGGGKRDMGEFAEPDQSVLGVRPKQNRDRPVKNNSDPRDITKGLSTPWKSLPRSLVGEFRSEGHVLAHPESTVTERSFLLTFSRKQEDMYPIGRKPTTGCPSQTTPPP
eukprot:756819-Hanusia_phi.AAC.2